MNPNVLKPISVLKNDEIREILIKRVDQEKQVVGIVAGIIEPNGRRVVGYGNFANADPRAVDGQTLFEIGSVSKVFTSLLLADMVSRTEVALDDPAAKYLPEGVKMPERNGKSITLLDLSRHTSGLPDSPTNLKVKDPANPYSDYNADDLYQFLSSYTLPRDPGSEFEYSNLGAGLLGHLLAYRARSDYESLIRSRITQPLGLADTGITLSSSMKQRMATGHSRLLAPVANIEFSALAGAGALRSTANDMLTFLEVFLGYKESLLAPAMKTMFEVRHAMGKADIGIGLAWNILGDGVWHNGRTAGFCSFVGCDLKARIGVVVLSNTANVYGADDMGSHLLNPKLPLAGPEPPKQRTEIHLDPKLLDNYVGRYQLNPNLTIEITRNGDHLFAQAFAHGNAAPKFELFAEGEKDFFSRISNPPRITFETGTDGRATSLVLRRAGRPDMPGTRLS